MRITKVISSAITKGKLIVKVLGIGSKDVQTVYNIAPFGIDSNPVAGMRAIWAKTDNLEDRILLGILFEKATAESGETIVYSTNSSGIIQGKIYLKKNGDIEINGNADNAVRYSKLDDKLQSFKTDINTELGKIATAINAIVPGSYTPALLSIDISDAKIDNIKTS